jgi:hypothetical protein
MWSQPIPRADADGNPYHLVRGVVVVGGMGLWAWAWACGLEHGVAHGRVTRMAMAMGLARHAAAGGACDPADCCVRRLDPASPRQVLLDTEGIDAYDQVGLGGTQPRPGPPWVTLWTAARPPQLAPGRNRARDHTQRRRRCARAPRPAPAAPAPRRRRSTPPRSSASRCCSAASSSITKCGGGGCRVVSARLCSCGVRCRAGDAEATARVVEPTPHLPQTPAARRWGASMRRRWTGSAWWWR